MEHISRILDRIACAPFSPTEAQRLPKECPNCTFWVQVSRRNCKTCEKKLYNKRVRKKCQPKRKLLTNYWGARRLPDRGAHVRGFSTRNNNLDNNSNNYSNNCRSCGSMLFFLKKCCSLQRLLLVFSFCSMPFSLQLATSSSSSSSSSVDVQKLVI